MCWTGNMLNLASLQRVISYVSSCNFRTLWLGTAEKFLALSLRLLYPLDMRLGRPQNLCEHCVTEKRLTAPSGNGTLFILSITSYFTDSWPISQCITRNINLLPMQKLLSDKCRVEAKKTHFLISGYLWWPLKSQSDSVQMTRIVCSKTFLLGVCFNLPISWLKCKSISV
jgi:hypothetical protein